MQHRPSRSNGMYYNTKPLPRQGIRIDKKSILLYNIDK